MAASETLYKVFKDVDQQNMLIKLTYGTDHPTVDNPVKACGPTPDFPEPWILEKFPGTSICSIISVGGELNETIVSMIPVDIAERVLQEIKDD